MSPEKAALLVRRVCGRENWEARMGREKVKLARLCAVLAVLFGLLAFLPK